MLITFLLAWWSCSLARVVLAYGPSGGELVAFQFGETLADAGEGVAEHLGVVAGAVFGEHPFVQLQLQRAEGADRLRVNGLALDRSWQVTGLRSELPNRC
jgi:hypothetical protein